MRNRVIEKFIDADAFARYLGIEILEVSKGSAKARLELKRHHLNSAGTVHGGVVFSLADAVFAVASNSHGTVAMAINVSIAYFRAVREGILYAEAKEVSINPRLATYTVDITDQDGQKVALFQGTVYRKRESIETLF
jgi:acyl-CoA thioesterase